MAYIALDDVLMVGSSSSSGIGSVVSSADRVRRVALAKARRETARREVDLARCNEELEEAELEEVRASSLAGSIGRLADVASEVGNSARARPGWSAGQAATPLQLESVQELATHLFTQDVLESSGLHAKAGSNAQGPSILFQQRRMFNWVTRV